MEIQEQIKIVAEARRRAVELKRQRDALKESAVKGEVDYDHRRKYITTEGLDKG